MNKQINWYNRSALIYDWTFDLPYWEVRRFALQSLNLQPGDVVLDVGCGTGVNFKHLLAQTQNDVFVYGIDPSVRMLSKAAKKIAKYGWCDKINLVRTPAEKLNHYDIPFDDLPPVKALCCLSLTVLSDWQSAFCRLYDLLPANSTIVIMDIYHKPGDFGGAFLDFIAASDTTRKVWRELEQQSHDFSIKFFSRPFKIFNVSMFVARGTKKA